MSAWVKTVVVVAVAVVPGAFVALLAYASARALQHGWREARKQSQSNVVPLRAVLKNVQIKEIVRHARLAAS
ncbi:MAG TPA: hypothetical protein VK447_07180 [Myxococcaceae bacterium]|nr:hypothetical protein [Myxococcaceae bacterium]